MRRRKSQEFPMTDGLIGSFYRTRNEIIDRSICYFYNSHPIQSYAYRCGEFIGIFLELGLAVDGQDIVPGIIGHTVQTLAAIDIFSKLISIPESFPIHQQYEIALEGIVGRGRRIINRFRT